MQVPPQRPWVGLTNNELQPIADEYRILFGSWVEDFARAIEAKLKQKNGYAEENTWNLFLYPFFGQWFRLLLLLLFLMSPNHS